MNDYISLEELRAMPGNGLVMRWTQSQFPFDGADCGQCVTQHKFITRCRHQDFQEQISHLKVSLRPTPDELRANLDKIYALRMFHRDLYPWTPEPPAAAQRLYALRIAEARLDELTWATGAKLQQQDNDVIQKRVAKLSAEVERLRSPADAKSTAPAK